MPRCEAASGTGPLPAAPRRLVQAWAAPDCQHAFQFLHVVLGLALLQAAQSGWLPQRVLA